MNPEDTPTARNSPPRSDADVDLARWDSIPPSRPPGFPTRLFVGNTLVDCRLVAELGCGATGKAFLAQQETLGERLIVLKVTKAASRHEQLNLARLQHTNIMPLYWAMTLPHEGCQVLAMPYLARTTLAKLLYILKDSARESWTGQRVFEVLASEQASMPQQIAIQAHPAQILKQSAWIEFVVRTVLTLAEALAYAHQRDLLHLDLKPANILITPDGQAILLDLDVAREPIPAGTTSVPWLGGTWLFMSPEQQTAITALKAGEPIPCAIDGRSDLYSLGLILYQALVGSCDEEHRPNPLELPRLNPQVSRGLADISARCLAQNPIDRYSDCDALAEDLRRHLNDLPLRGVRNRLPERWRKWRRRRPLGLLMFLLLAGFCCTAGTAGFKFFQRNEDRRQQAEAALHDGQEWQRKGQYAEATSRFLAGKELAEQTYGADHLQTDLSRRLRQTQRLQKAEELDKLVHLLRFYALQDLPSRRLQWVLEAAGRKLWAERDLVMDRSAGTLEVVIERNILDQLLELVFLWSDLRIRNTPPSHAESVRAEVRTVLVEAERMLGSSFGLSVTREQLGDAAGSRPNPQAAWEFCAQGRIALGKGQHAEAARFMQAALDRDPLGFVPNFYLGVCALRQRKYERAVQALSFCAGQQPSPECFLLRGQALAALGETDRALEDFNHALEKNPELGGAYLQRGNLYRDQGRLEEAEKDFQLARKLSE